jgi:hypothetical protein
LYCNDLRLFFVMDVLDWLLDSDPAIRWQVLRDLTDQPFPAGGTTTFCAASTNSAKRASRRTSE